MYLYLVYLLLYYLSIFYPKWFDGGLWLNRQIGWWVVLPELTEQWAAAHPPLRGELIQPAADDGSAGLRQGGEAGVGGDHQVLLRLCGIQTWGGQAAGGGGGGRGLPHRAVALSVGAAAGVEGLGETLGPRQLVGPGEQRPTDPLRTSLLQSQSISVIGLFCAVKFLQSGIRLSARPLIMRRSILPCLIRQVC